jgi:RimJ/RimL family protein N-acetyltransferase
VSTPILRTPRLLLREWRAEDRAPFAALNADARVMEHLPALLPRRQSDALARRSERHFAKHGFGPWAVEVPGVASFIGFVGLVVPAFEAPFTPCVEIGWRLAAEHWGQGYATEAALASARHAFDVAGVEQLVSFTTPPNVRSQAVMQRIGMTHDPVDDFDHPRFPEGHRLRRHVLYRLNADGENRGTLDV